MCFRPVVNRENAAARDAARRVAENEDHTGEGAPEGGAAWRPARCGGARVALWLAWCGSAGTSLARTSRASWTQRRRHGRRRFGERSPVYVAVKFGDTEVENVLVGKLDDLYRQRRINVDLTSS